MLGSSRSPVGTCAVVLGALALLAATPVASAGQRSQKGKPPGGGGGPSGITASAFVSSDPGPGVKGDGQWYEDGQDGSVLIDGGSDFDLEPAGRVVLIAADVSTPLCTGRKCKCEALTALGSVPVPLDYLRVNIDGGNLCGMFITEEIPAGRAQANVNGCFVTWNEAPPAAPPTLLDGVAITRTALDTWEISTNDDATAWLWSDGRRGSRRDEGVSSIPFTVTVTATCPS